MTNALGLGRGDSPSETVGWIGSLAHTPLAEVFLRIVHEGRSGDLQVTLNDAIKTVYFDRGFVVLASSNLKNDRLGESMIEAGRISRQEFALASMVIRSSHRKLGETLVEAGILSEEELGHQVATQVNRIVLSLFSAKSGMYSFDERPCTIPVELMVSLSVYRILLEGVRRMARKKLVMAGLPPLETRLRVAPHPPFSLDLERLRPVEKEVLRAAAEQTSIARIVEILGNDEGVALRAVYGLCCAGLLEKVSVESRSKLRVQEETGTFVLSEIRRKIERAREPSASPSFAPEIEERPADPAIEASPPEPSPAAAEDPEAPAAPVASPPAAGERRPPPSLSPRFEPLTEPGRRKRRSPLRRLWDRFERALLRWVGSQAAEAEQLETAAPPAALEGERRDERSYDPAPAAPEAEAEELEPQPPMPEPSEAPPPSAGREPEEPEETAFELEASPEAWSLPEGAPAETGSEAVLPPLDNELFIEGELLGDDAPSMLSHIPVEEIEIDVEVEMADPEAEAPAVFPEEVEGADPVPEEREVSPPPTDSLQEAPPETPRAGPSSGEELLSRRAGEMLRARQGGGEARLLRDVKLHFKLQDWEGAVPLLEQLVRISPGSAFYRGMLARAMSRQPMMRKHAEEHFIEALRLAPHDAELHYWLGLYYKSFGLKARAETEFRTTLRIDPRHQGARRQLSGNRKDDAMGAVIKKLFGS